MFSTEQRRIAIETFIRFDHGYADAIAELGYPTRHSLRAWHKDYLGHGEVGPPKRRREPEFTLEMRRAAVDYCLAHGKGLAGTMRRMGCPASREHLCGWIDELAPGQRRYGGPSPKAGPVPLAEKIRAVAEPGSRGGTAAEVAEEHGAPRAAPCVWRREMMGDNGGGARNEGRARGQGIRRPARRHRGPAGHAARGEDAAQAGAARARSAAGDPRDGKKKTRAPTQSR